MGFFQSKSGSGSTVDNTVVLRTTLQKVFIAYNIKSMLDIPCGDFNWMQLMDLSGISYQGADIVEPLVKHVSSMYPGYTFSVLDIVNDDLPKVDLVFTRDCLGHLSNANVLKALKNVKKSAVSICLLLALHVIEEVILIL